jgi:hypothetical protein
MTKQRVWYGHSGSLSPVIRHITLCDGPTWSSVLCAYSLLAAE